MEGYLTYRYEYHFLYITGIEHVESKSIQGASIMKLQFHPGTDMSQAMSETVSYVNRARAFMPPGTVAPFIMRFDAGSVAVGYLVFSTEDPNISLNQMQDQALNRVRPAFATLPGVSAPPPFGGSSRSIVVNVNPDRMRSYGLSPDDIVQALAQGNTISPSGNMNLGEQVSDRAGQRHRHEHQGPRRRAAEAHRQRRGVRARRGHGRGRRRPHHFLRAREWPAHGLPARDQARRRLDARSGQPGEEEPAGVSEALARRHQGQLRVRPIAGGEARHPGPAQGGRIGRDPHRLDGAAVPARLAQRVHRGDQHPAVALRGRIRLVG